MIMPAYNAEKFISQSIESVLGQTYKNIEFVIVNDGSPDSTPDIIINYEKDNPDTILFVNKDINEGTAVTLNTAMQYASGDYICWLSADDLYMDTMIESSLKFLIDNPMYDACYSLSATINENNKLLAYENNTGEYFDQMNAGNNSVLYKRLLLLGNVFHGCSLFSKRDNYLNAGYFDPQYRYAHDYDFWLRFAAISNIGFLNAYNVMGRTYPTQISRQGKCDEDAIRVYDSFVSNKDSFINLMHRAGFDDYNSTVIEGYINRIEGYKKHLNELSLAVNLFNSYLESRKIID